MAGLEGNGSPEDSAERETIRRMVEQKYGVRSEFMRVADLARVTGIAESSIRVQMSEGRFPIPHRKIGNSVVVKVEDYVEWHCSGSKPDPAKARMRAERERSLLAERAADMAAAGIAPEPEPRKPIFVRSETPKELAARIKREAMEAVKRKFG